MHQLASNDNAWGLIGVLGKLMRGLMCSKLMCGQRLMCGKFSLATATNLISLLIDVIF